MNAIFCVSNSNTGCGQVALAYKEALERFCGWNILLIEDDHEGSGGVLDALSKKKYDYLHYWSTLETLIIPGLPTGQTIHGFSTSEALQNYVNHIRVSKIRVVHALDPFTATGILTMANHKNPSGVFFTPQLTTFSGLQRNVPAPEVFTIGHIGVDPIGKRVPLIQQLAESCSVPCHLFDSTQKDEEELLSREQVGEFLSGLSVYVSAHTYPAAGPVPGQEALFTGVPILTTPAYTMLEFLVPGINGEMFDGSLEDAVRKLKRIQNNYEHYRQGVCRSVTDEFLRARAERSARSFAAEILERIQ